MNWNAYKTLLTASLRRRGVKGTAMTEALAAAREAFEQCDAQTLRRSKQAVERTLNQPFYAERKDRDQGPFEFFKAHYGRKPPFADELRRYDEALYRAMSVKCSRNRAAGKTPDSLSDLMPIRPEARGGSIAAFGKVITPEDAWETLQRRRGEARQRMNELRKTRTRDPQ